MFSLKRHIPALAVVLAPLFAACSDSLSPDSVDPQHLQSRMGDITHAFDNASFQSAAASATLFPQFAGVAAFRMAGIADPRLRGTGLLAQVRARRESARLYSSLRSSPQALFPANVLGKTLQWDTQLHEYVIGTLTGAPANGVRILIYTLDQTTFEPIFNQELGYLELTDESSPQADRLGVLITLGVSPVADYVISVVNTTTQLSSLAEGFIRNATGTEQVDFDFNESITATALTGTADLVGSNGGHVVVDIGSNATAQTLTVGVGEGRNNLSMSVALDENTDDIAGEVKYNGTVVATIDGTIDDPSFTAASGRTLTQSERNALGLIFLSAVIIVADVAFGVFAPGVIVFN